MIWNALIIVAVGFAVWITCEADAAESDITIAAIATGRLYVVGTTERPHTPVSLDDRFTTESDDAGRFQYELVYHPAQCIVAARIDNKVHEAVVSNCGQQEASLPAAAAPRESPNTVKVAPSAAPEQTATVSRSAPTFVVVPTNVGTPHATEIRSPPLPPVRPVVRAAPRAKLIPHPKPRPQQRPARRETTDNPTPLSD